MAEHREERIDGSLKLTTSRYGREVVCVSLIGELDAANVATAEEVLSREALTDNSLLIVDLYELTFIDSSGIALLVALSKVPKSAGRLRILPSPSRQVSRILELTQIGGFVHIATDRSLLTP